MFVEFDAFVPSDQTNREAALGAFMLKVKSILQCCPEWMPGRQQIALIILELIKNTFDHSDGAGFLEMSLPNDAGEIVIKYLDSGSPFDWDANC